VSQAVVTVLSTPVLCFFDGNSSCSVSCGFGGAACPGWCPPRVTLFDRTKSQLCSASKEKSTPLMHLARRASEGEGCGALIGLCVGYGRLVAAASLLAHGSLCRVAGKTEGCPSGVPLRGRR
jgi:hypothetical protein